MDPQLLAARLNSVMVCANVTSWEGWIAVSGTRNYYRTLKVVCEMIEVPYPAMKRCISLMRYDTPEKRRRDIATEIAKSKIEEILNSEVPFKIAYRKVEEGGSYNIYICKSKTLKEIQRHMSSRGLANFRATSDQISNMVCVEADLDEAEPSSGR